MVRATVWASLYLVAVAAGSSPGAGPTTKDAGQEGLATVTGSVKFASGREPKERCIVTALDPSGKVVAATVARADGQFRLKKLPKAKMTVLAAVLAGRVSPAVAVDTSGPVDPIELKAYDDSLGGSVRDRAGKGIAGARVTIAPKEGDERGSLLAGMRSMVTEADGSYRFDAVAPGDYALTASARGYGVRVEKGIKVEEGADVAVTSVVLEPFPLAR